MRRLLMLLFIVAAPASAADLCITVPNSTVPDITNAFSERFNRPDTIVPTPAPGQTPGVIEPTPIPNPETKSDFTRRIVREWVAEIAADQRANQSAERAKTYRAAVIRGLINGVPTPTTAPTP
jgi:hypothetical protein